jgi:hypothetical protein
MARAPGFGPAWEVTLTPLAAYHLFPWLFRVETSANSHFVILSAAKDLAGTGSYEILPSLRSLRMTGDGTFAEVKQATPASCLLRRRLSPAATKKLLDRHPVRTPL